MTTAPFFICQMKLILWYNNLMPSFLRTGLLCLLALMLNFLTVFIFYDAMHLPLFLDTIFTVAVTFYLGLLPGLFVSLAYNFLNPLIWYFLGGVLDPFIFLYSICGILIVFSTWIFARNKDEFKISFSITMLYLLLIAMLSSFLTVISSGIIDYFHMRYVNIPDMMSPIKKFTESFLHQRFPLLAACILGQIPVSFTDRMVTTFAGFGVYKLCEKFLGRR